VLGLLPQPHVEIADPHAANCVSHSTSARARRPASRAFSTLSAGPGFQQIALSTDDIFPAAEAAKANRVAFLSIPDNYYDDLATRFDIAPDPLTRIRSFGVLYDPVKDGELFHIYTRSFRDRFFSKSSNAATTTCS
jgi:4-hydroxyphenylpyruvate dioxygenase